MIVNCSHEWELHCHSRFSDGALNPRDLFELAQTNGIKHLALTDHDTAAGYRASVEQGWVPEGLTLYPATELSCVWGKRTVHVVGLGIDAFSDSWMEIERDYNNRREKRFHRILYLLGKADFTLDEASIRELAEPGPPARPHIARYLTESNQVKSEATAFKRWLGRGKAGDVKSHWPDLAEAVSAINRCGGIAVVAHPHQYQLTWTKARELMADFVEAGGAGVEVACVGMHPDFSKFMVEQANSHGLMVSGGSDFHRPGKSWVKLGTYPQWPNRVADVRDWLLEKGGHSLS